MLTLINFSVLRSPLKSGGKHWAWSSIDMIVSGFVTHWKIDDGDLLRWHEPTVIFLQWDYEKFSQIHFKLYGLKS